MEKIDKYLFSIALCVWTGAQWKVTEVRKGSFLKPEEAWMPARVAKEDH